MVQKPNLEGVDVISWKQFWGEFGISDTQEFMETAVTIPVKQSIIFLSIVSNDLSLYQHIVLIVDRWPTVSMVHLSCRSKETCRLATELHWAWHGDNICACICIYQNFWCQFFWSTDHQKVSLRDVLLTRASRAEFCNCLFLFASFSLKWNILKRLRFSSNSPEWIALWCLEERISSSQWKTLRFRPWHPPSTK